MVGAWVFLYRVKCVPTRSSTSFLKKLFILIEGWLLNNIVMASATHQHESVTGICVTPPSFEPPSNSLPPPPSRLSWSTGFQFPTLYIKLALTISFTDGIYMFQCYSFRSSHPLLLPLCPKVCSLWLCLLRCPAHRIIGTIFLDSIYMY